MPEARAPPRPAAAGVRTRGRSGCSGSPTATCPRTRRAVRRQRFPSLVRGLQLPCSRIAVGASYTTPACPRTSGRA
eukprot:4784067-Alexandrium_andersonii.AAC.1